jgi:hypothetical protein
MPYFLKIDFLRGKDADAISKGRIIRNMLVGHLYAQGPLPAGVFTPDQLGEIIDRTQAACDLALGHDTKAIAARKLVRLEFDNAFKNLARHLEIWANGDPVKLQNLGYDVRKPPKKSLPAVVPLPAPSLKVTHGLLPGTMIAKMSALLGAFMYELQVTMEDPSVEANWKQQGLHPLPSKIPQMEGYISGSNYWFRGRGIGTTGNGIWSTPFPLRSL